MDKLESNPIEFSCEDDSITKATFKAGIIVNKVPFQKYVSHDPKWFLIRFGNKEYITGLMNSVSDERISLNVFGFTVDLVSLGGDRYSIEPSETALALNPHWRQT